MSSSLLNLVDNLSASVHSDKCIDCKSCLDYMSVKDECIEIYKREPAHFLSAPGLGWQACLKKTGIVLELLTDGNMLLMVEKGIRDVIQYIDMQKQATNT